MGCPGELAIFTTAPCLSVRTASSCARINWENPAFSSAFRQFFGRCFSLNSTSESADFTQVKQHPDATNQFRWQPGVFSPVVGNLVREIIGYDNAVKVMPDMPQKTIYSTTLAAGTRTTETRLEIEA